eukprot:1189304-Prorocentrum_minimum.AAC.2
MVNSAVSSSESYLLPDPLRPRDFPKVRVERRQPIQRRLRLNSPPEDVNSPPEDVKSGFFVLERKNRTDEDSGNHEPVHWLELVGCTGNIQVAA